MASIAVWCVNKSVPFCRLMRTLHAAELTALGCLVAAAWLAISALAHAAGHFEWHPIYLWVGAPYVLCAAALMFPWGVARRRMMAGCATAVAMLIFTFLFYVEGLVRSTSSTSPLIVIFAPLYLVVGGAALWALIYAVGWRRVGAPEE